MLAVRLAARSYWIVLYFFAYNIFGAYWGNDNTGYSAHLTGFFFGFSLAMIMLVVGFIKMEEDERSLLQIFKVQKTNAAMFDRQGRRIKTPIAGDTEISGKAAVTETCETLSNVQPSINNNQSLDADKFFKSTAFANFNVSDLNSLEASPASPEAAKTVSVKRSINNDPLAPVASAQTQRFRPANRGSNRSQCSAPAETKSSI